MSRRSKRRRRMLAKGAEAEIRELRERLAREDERIGKLDCAIGRLLYTTVDKYKGVIPGASVAESVPLESAVLMIERMVEQMAGMARESRESLKAHGEIPHPKTERRVKLARTPLEAPKAG